jgi:hypothetical protein
MKHEYTTEEWAVLTKLWDMGYALIIFKPAELRGADPVAVQDRCTEHGWDVIDSLATEDSQDE